MKRYHASAVIKSVAPVMPPMSPEEKKASVAKFEARHAAIFGGKIEIVSDSEIQQEMLLKPLKAPKAIDPLIEVNRRLDELVAMSERILKQMKEQFGE